MRIATFFYSSQIKSNLFYFLFDRFVGDCFCGNGDLDSGERCDGSNLDGETCISQGFTGGILACGAGCDEFE